MKNNQSVKILAQALYNVCHGKSAKQVDLILLNFTKLLEEKRLWPQLADIIQQLKNLEQAEQNIITVKLTSTHELSSAEQKHLGELVTRLTDKKVLLESTVKTEMIGGAILKYQDKILDLSLQNKLNKLAEHLVS